MKFLFASVLILSILGGFTNAKLFADPAHTLGTDGYYFSGYKGIPKYNFRVQIHLEGTGTDMVTDYFKAYPKNGITPGYELRGFYVFNKDTGTCHIYMYDPNVAYWPETYGHELMHCIYGNFHDEQSNQRLKDILNGVG